jgi:hypothetical protein
MLPPRAGDTSNIEVEPTAVASFLSTLSSTLQPPLCPTPPVPRAKHAPASKELEGSLRSSRLAAKPTVGLSTMDKIKIILLKKHGQEVNEADPKEDLKKYSDIYKQQLPPDYIKAVAALVEANKTKGKVNDFGANAGPCMICCAPLEPELPLVSPMYHTLPLLVCFSFALVCPAQMRPVVPRMCVVSPVSPPAPQLQLWFLCQRCPSLTLQWILVS